MARMPETGHKNRRRQRRNFTEEFKAGAVRLVLDEAKSVAHVARDLDLTASSLAGWVERARAAAVKSRIVSSNAARVCGTYTSSRDGQHPDSPSMTGSKVGRPPPRGTSAPTHVIFDLDGTLLDTEPAYREALSILLGRFGRHAEDVTALTMPGGDPRTNAARVIAHLELPVTVDDYLRMREEILRGLLASTTAMPGASPLVAALQRRRVPLAIATNSPRDLCQLKLRPHAFATAFGVVVCGDDPGIRDAKPAPDLYLAAARLLHAHPEHCLVFEDSPSGVLAASRAGMRVIAVPSGGHVTGAWTSAEAVLPTLLDLSLADVGL